MIYRHFIYSSIFYLDYFCATSTRLQVSQDTLGTGSLNALGVIILGSVDNLAVVDDEGETASSLTKVPADAGRELGSIISHEELNQLVSYFCLICDSINLQLSHRGHRWPWPNRS